MSVGGRGLGRAVSQPLGPGPHTQRLVRTVQASTVNGWVEEAWRHREVKQAARSHPRGLGEAGTGAP